MIRLYILLALLGSSFALGGYTVHRFHRVSALKAQVASLQLEKKRFRAALEIGEKAEGDFDATELGNDEIQRALLERASKLVREGKVSADGKSTGSPPDSRFSCVDAQWVLDLGSLK